MDTIILFDPSIRSFNKGDEVIMSSAEFELRKSGILNGNFVIHSATHAPIMTWYQDTSKNSRMRLYNNAKYKFICGSNLLWKSMVHLENSLNVDITNCGPYKDSILMGVGSGRAKQKINLYTKYLYSRILSKEYIHSVRDEATAVFLRSLGYKAIDTGCPSMWRFTPSFCSDIPHSKSKNVVFTLTDYGQNRELDQKLVNILLDNYESVYFWIQGIDDLAYIKSLSNTGSIKIVSPDLESFSLVLEMDNIEYVGTRLHAGMYALQHKKRTTILIIDNRTRDLSNSYDLHTLERNRIDDLPKLINSSFSTNVKIKQDNIDLWMTQFEKGKNNE